MEIFVYRQGAEKIEEGFSVSELPNLLADETNVVWVDLRGETPSELEQAKNILLNIFHFHYLTVEDCLETRNQPKVEAFPEYIYFIVHGVKPEVTNPTFFTTKELDGYLGKNFVVTFHTERFKSIKNVKQQLRASTFACRRGAAYLLHQILDQVVDLYMPLLDDFESAINSLEERVFQMRKAENALLEEIMDLRRSVVRLKRISVRQLEVLYRISHGEFPQIPENVIPFYRDVHDHLLRISDLSESYRDLVSSLFDIHFSVVANKTNDIVKFLTIFSAIWLPLSFIAGVYGMNFDNMPELHTTHGYFMTLGLMLVIALGLIGYFWYKGWIFKRETVPEETPADAEIHTTRIND
ncbi:MAG TPA: magnesium/cobalt transporter CorA [Pyrinomonadaceae bacterium]|jgi:magnesium transporter